jgi:hypothetical protein
MDRAKRATRHPAGRAAALTLLAVIVLAAGGCDRSGDSEAAPGPTGVAGAASAGTASAPSAPPPTSPVDLAKEQAVAAYLGMWQAMAKAGETSDWQAPELSRYASGSALQTITGSLYADHRNGFVSKGRPVNRPQVTSAEPPDDPTTVMISDCGDSTTWLQYRTDGSLVDESPGGRRSITAEAKLHSDGVWRVTRFAVQGIGSC